MQDVVILSAARTPIGSFLGSLTDVPAPRLGAAALSAAVQWSGVPSAAIGQVLMGNVLQAGIGQAPARQAGIYAGLPHATGAVTVSKVCGSGLRAVMDAANGIRVGDWTLAAAGGMESMSRAPHLAAGTRVGFRMGDITLVDSMIRDGLWDPYGDTHMGQCAEACARKYGFTRAAQDAYALESYRRARHAIEAGAFAAELTPVTVPQRKGEGIKVERDEEPFKAPLDKIATLKPAFATDGTGTVTAANASKINDGAAALVLAAADTAAAHGHRTLARIVSQASYAHEPAWFTTAPAGAVRAALQRARLRVSDIDRWEINEAFAVVAMAAIRDLELDPAKVNVRGGAVALGHPIGCSGARILTTLVHTLQQDQQRYGCAAICIGGGEALAMIVENLTLTL